ncbi:polysaccharide biosynthesis protein [Natronococcus pandeyae]|uniref:Polysaccharide biosynthesis protein n=1 Tax=Natronococcus pandeyae TaxID=2055836 RepID=A0A8J8TTJ0_9EURY|nr:polysaccharide biosynthesis C-terminal domain-containing protein [Natronococcus pandeyae]TYL39969.1 polysaccharide biosynthesis protein [Natronococcus pandeyae]
MNRSLSSGVLSVVSAKIVILIVGILSTPILFRLLEPAGFGDYSFLMSVFAIYMIFVSSGIADGVRKFLAEERSMQDWEPYVVGYYFRLALLFSLTGAFLMILSSQSGLVTRLFGAEYTPYFYGLALLVVSVQFQTYSRKTLMGFGLERYSEPLNILDKVAFVVVAIPLVYLDFGVTGALAGHAVASIAVGVIGLMLIHQRVPLSNVFRTPPSNFPRKKMLTFNSMSIVLLFLLTSLYHIDVVMLQHFRESADVGNYRAALTLAEFLWFVPLALQTVYVHSTSELWSRNRTKQITSLASKTTRYTFLLTAIMAVGLAALADIAVPIYFGPDATPAIEPLLLLLPGALGFALARPILAVSQGEGTLRYPVAATGVAATINVVLNFLLIPRYGMHGAAVATSVGYGGMFAFHCVSARHVGFDPLADARFSRIVATTALAAIPIFALAAVITNEWLALVIVPPTGLAIYLTFAVLTGAITPAEPFEVLAEFPEPIGSRAAFAQERLEGVHADLTIAGWVQSMLFLTGVTFLLSGLLIALFGTEGGTPVFG